MTSACTFSWEMYLFPVFLYGSNVKRTKSTMSGRRASMRSPAFGWSTLFLDYLLVNLKMSRTANVSSKQDSKVKAHTWIKHKISVILLFFSWKKKQCYQKSLLFLVVTYRLITQRGEIFWNKPPWLHIILNHTQGEANGTAHADKHS